MGQDIKSLVWVGPTKKDLTKAREAQPRQKRAEVIRCEQIAGNVYADLNHDDADEMLDCLARPGRDV